MYMFTAICLNYNMFNKHVLTDGHSNGSLDICQTAKCFHDQTLYNINIFAIGMDKPSWTVLLTKMILM